VAVKRFAHSSAVAERKTHENSTIPEHHATVSCCSTGVQVDHLQVLQALHHRQAGVPQEWGEFPHSGEDVIAGDGGRKPPVFGQRPIVIAPGPAPRPAAPSRVPRLALSGLDPRCSALRAGASCGFRDRMLVEDLGPVTEDRLQLLVGSAFGCQPPIHILVLDLDHRAIVPCRRDFRRGFVRDRRE
jgi:hypothetical protein